MNTTENANKIRHSIRSYANRQRNLNAAQQRWWQLGWKLYGSDVHADVSDVHADVHTNGMHNFQHLFGRMAPTILEISFGSGHSFAALANLDPQQNYLGVEIYRPGVATLLGRLLAQNCQNAKIFCAQAEDVLQHCIPDVSLAAILIYFPDPWPKRRHQKRRLIQPSFVELLIRKLQPAGFLELATDWENYASHMMKVLTARCGLVNCHGEGQFAERSALRPITKFEQRGLQLGHRIWDLQFQRKEI